MQRPDSVLLSILQGFWVTFRNLFRPLQTLEYPEVKRPQPPNFRGKHKLQRYEDGLERCVGCALCAAVCPSEAIYLEAAENTEEDRVSPGERYSKRYEIHLLRCIFCGFCAEACPENAIVLGPEYELAAYRRESCVMSKDDLLTSREEGFGTHPSLKPNVAS
jgi:NADH-quinone oxidoreductase subunit I